ncbi:MAG TPA: hypothetical protein VFD94_06075 [Jatrophihabitans sp.]|nr:hypothetical protein [Jatrophihabitans sp.]
MADGIGQADGYRYASITTLSFRHWWQVGSAHRRWRAMTAEFASSGHDIRSMFTCSRRRRSITIVSMVREESVLRAATGTIRHVEAVRWSIPRKTRLWSAVFELSGWSSMSGPPDGAWSHVSATRPPAIDPD